MTSIAFDSAALEQPRGLIFGSDDTRSETASVTLSGGALHHGFSVLAEASIITPLPTCRLLPWLTGIPGTKNLSSVMSDPPANTPA